MPMPPLYGGGFWVAYLPACGVYYAAVILLHFIVPRLFPVSSVQVGKPRTGQVAQEARNSLGPLAVKAAVWTFVEHLHTHPTPLRMGGPLLYSAPLFPHPLANALYYGATIIALDYAHDAWFYWTHRLLHTFPWLYRHIHVMHHRSTVPTAFCGYSFHIVEAVIVFANEVLVCFIFPIHIGLHRLYHMYTTIIHNGGHAGYEIAPLIPSLEGLVALAFRVLFGSGGGERDSDSIKKKEGFVKTVAPSSSLNTVRHHDMHHRFPNVHFSLYMTHWDRWMGTEHPKYRELVNNHFMNVGESVPTTTPTAPTATTPTTTTAAVALVHS